MRLQESKLAAYSLDDWVEAFDQVYAGINKDRSTEGLMLHLVEHTGEIQEDLRIGRYHQAVIHLADAFCWACAIVRRSATEYGTARSYTTQVLWKFPGCCHHCAARVCICPLRGGVDIDDKVTKARLELQNKESIQIAREETASRREYPPPLDELVRMFRTMYAHLNFVTPEESLVAHLQEEVGEVAECINNIEDIRHELKALDGKDWRNELEQELPDILVWTVALIGKIDYVLGSAKKYFDFESLDRRNLTLEEREAERRIIRTRPQTIGLELSQLLWDRYGDPVTHQGLRCPRCEQPVCRGNDPPLGKE